MDLPSAATLQLIAKAFALSPTRYSVTVSPHPTRPNAYDVLFSLPTAAAPESPLFVKLTLSERVEAADDTARYFDGVVESQRWPIPFSISSAAVLADFPHDCIDVAWQQKLQVSRVSLWAR